MSPVLLCWYSKPILLSVMINLNLPVNQYSNHIRFSEKVRRVDLTKFMFKSACLPLCSIMLIILSALFLLSVRASTSEDLIIFDNFDYGEMLYGSEDKMVDYAVLSLDRRADLPQSFTICSLVHLNFVTSSIFLYQLYQDDGKPRFSLAIGANRDLNRFQDVMKL